MFVKCWAVIGCSLLGDCSTNTVSSYDMNGFGNNAERENDYLDEFDDVRFSDSFYRINC